MSIACDRREISLDNSCIELTSLGFTTVQYSTILYTEQRYKEETREINNIRAVRVHKEIQINSIDSFDLI